MDKRYRGWRAFACAFRGIWYLVRCEPHGRVHLLTAMGVVGAAWWLGCDAVEWALLGLAIGLVGAAEALNTAVERLCDFVQPAHDARVRDIKDLAAGGVLLASLAAAGVGLAVLGPLVWERWVG